MDNEYAASSDGGDVADASSEATRILREDPNFTTAGHKRSLSGSILSKLSFLRPSNDSRSHGSESLPAEDQGNTPGGARVGNNLGTALAAQKKTRSRKGSLRKTALLGTGKLRLERKASDLNTILSPRLDTQLPVTSPGAESPTISSPESDDFPTPRASYDQSIPRDLNGSSPSPSQETTGSHSRSLSPVSGIRRTSTIGDMSTTDEDELLNFPRIAAGLSSGSVKKHPSSDSYFPTIQRRRSANRAKSPLATLPLEPVPTPEEWDYSETEWWGWIILIVTWVVFVVGIGSCFEVWSWAWDVGETPYAPPELEDDPTLPIVGYYPALIILTGVMAWVWVIIAWVGMKYFRHAKISGEDV